MPAVSTKVKKDLSPLERFLGKEARVLNREQLAINNYIQAEWLNVGLPEDNLPEEDMGRLYLFPIDDNKYSLELLFIQYTDTSEDSATVCSLKFLPSFFDQYPAEALMANQPFRFDEVTEQQFSASAQTRLLLAQIEKTEEVAPFIKLLQQSQAAIHLLRLALESISAPVTTYQVPACRFLAYASERDKIQEARLIIEQHIDQPHTIRELSRKVAMNECYLKKGFKTVVGKTIHEYQQELRIAKAKELLQLEGRSVTDVANTLGYSSISHFSTAFKRVTGMKPCELLA